MSISLESGLFMYGDDLLRASYSSCEYVDGHVEEAQNDLNVHAHLVVNL